MNDNPNTLSPARRAAETKRRRYGADGLAAIAERAYRARRKRQGDRLTELERYVAASASAAQARAARSGIACHDDLPRWALAMMKAQDGRCALSGVPFRLDVLGHGAAPRPFAPSVDRRDASGGYTVENIRLICWGVNCLLGTWGDEPALELARGMVAQLGGDDA